MAQNKWLWGNFFVGLVDEGREIKPRLQRLAASPPATLWNRERETKPFVNRIMYKQKLTTVKLLLKMVVIHKLFII